jgi:hypothetical protein
MPEHETIPTLIRSALNDARQLVREEIALARAEIRDEISAARRIAIGFSAAALLGMIGVVILCIALGGAIADVIDAPPWVGYGIVALLLGGAAFLIYSRARTRLANVRALPQTRESVRETMGWIRSKSTDR